MKKIIFLFLMALASTAFAQHQNLNTLPEKQRNKILVEIANKTIERYSTGYLRQGAEPIIQDVGILTEEKRGKDEYLPCEEEYIGRYIYAVYYKGTEEEHNYSWYKKEFLVKAYILADIGKVTVIRYIDDISWMGALEKHAPDKVYHKRRYCTPAEREVAREEQRRKALIKTPEEEKALREERERFEEIQRRKDAQWDSIKAAHKARVLEMRKRQEEKAKKNGNL